MITLYLFDEEYKNSAAVTIDPTQVESAIATKRRIAWGGMLDVVILRMRSGDEHVVYGDQRTIDQIQSVLHPFIAADPHWGHVAEFDAQWKRSCDCDNGCCGVGRHVCKSLILRKFLREWGTQPSR